jgi:MipA family protein
MILPVRCMTRALTQRAVLALLLGASAGVALAAGPERKFDGAVTLMSQYGPDYLGARDSGVSVRPGFYARWGRVSISSGGGWAARRQEVELTGLGIDLAHSETFDASLGLRSDSGRQESDSPALAGMGSVKRTLRARLSAEWRFAPRWQLGAVWTIDAFGRGGGNVGELRLKHEWRLSDRLTVSSGAGVSLAGDRYLQTYFGVTPEQSLRSGYPVYSPSMGLRDVQLYTSMKYELGDHWVLTGGPGVMRVVGPAARSPLTQRRLAWSLNGGVGYRF